VDEINQAAYRAEHKTPVAELAPLPSSAQFLNVIESVFSGRARAIIHNIRRFRAAFAITEIFSAGAPYHWLMRVWRVTIVGIGLSP
jgi:hypothetical protein